MLESSHFGSIGCEVDSWFHQQDANNQWSELKMERVDAGAYPKYKDRILGLQKRIYEPARQSPPEEFDTLFRHANAIGIVVLRGNEIVAKTFAGPLTAFQNERGVPSDPYLQDESVFYSMDLTVTPEFQRGLGKILKRASVLQALEQGRPRSTVATVTGWPEECGNQSGTGKLRNSTPG